MAKFGQNLSVREGGGGAGRYVRNGRELEEKDRMDERQERKEE